MSLIEDLRNHWLGVKQEYQAKGDGLSADLCHQFCEDIFHKLMEPKLYVLCYEAHVRQRMFFKGQNLYLGVADMTGVLEEAAKMTLDEAESKLSCMSKQDDWEIWSLTHKMTLGRRSNRHEIKLEKEELKKQISELKKQLKQIEEQEGS